MRLRADGNSSHDAMTEAVWSAVLAASPPPEGLREALALIIAPGAREWSNNRRDAFAKADQIIRLLTEGR